MLGVWYTAKNNAKKSTLSNFYYIPFSFTPNCMKFGVDLRSPNIPNGLRPERLMAGCLVCGYGRSGSIPGFSSRNPENDAPAGIHELALDVHAYIRIHWHILLYYATHSMYIYIITYRHYIQTIYRLYIYIIYIYNIIYLYIMYIDRDRQIDRHLPIKKKQTWIMNLWGSPSTGAAALARGVAVRCPQVMWCHRSLTSWIMLD